VGEDQDQAPRQERRTLLLEPLRGSLSLRDTWLLPGIWNHERLLEGEVSGRTEVGQAGRSAQALLTGGVTAGRDEGVWRRLGDSATR